MAVQYVTVAQALSPTGASTRPGSFYLNDTWSNILGSSDRLLPLLSSGKILAVSATGASPFVTPVSKLLTNNANIYLTNQFDNLILSA